MDREEFIRKQTREVISYLGFYDKKTSGKELENVIKTYKYVIQNIVSNPEYSEKANNLGLVENYMQLLEIALTENPGSPATNSILFHHLLTNINQKSYIVKCKSNKSETPHICNLVRIGRQYYYFDATLDRSILDERLFSANDLMLCAGMGKTEYERLYTPVEALRKVDRGAKKSKEPFSKISDESIGRIIVNSINLKIPNLRRNPKQRTAQTEKNEEDMEIE